MSIDSVSSSWQTASSNVAGDFPKLASEFSKIDPSSASSLLNKRLTQYTEIASKLNPSTASPTLALLMYALLGIEDQAKQSAVKSEFEVDAISALIAKFSSAFGGGSSNEPVDLVEIVDLTDFEVQEEDPFTSVDSLKELTIELFNAIDVSKIATSAWTNAIHTCWVSSVRSVVSSLPELARFITLIVENLDFTKMNPFWREDSDKWFEMADEAQTKLDVAALLYSIELMIPENKFKAGQRWEGQRYEWHHALKRFPNETLQPVKEVIRVSYELPLDEEGHATAGHKCITEQDKALAEADGSALLFGEFLATGVQRAFDKEHLDGANAEVIYDFGMGLGKLMLQVYLQFPNCKKFVGVELSPSRYILGRDALRRFASFTGGKYQKVNEDSKTITVADDESRILEFREQNLFDATDGLPADIIILETHFPQGIWDRLRKYLFGMKPGARLLTYENLHNVYQGQKMPFEQIPINIAANDRFYTTWSPKRGHHFYLWRRNNVQL
eukprot:TRINITY_DN5070_c0_g1_i1.p2 TRINITY_DN5070_c0_g1~~TRINITY_DN5070_c0_g1_i1.p2  ORF type:complete len:501 (+),score=157.58 TRINITY_DN5070_c0_g1_i1:2042-3544(+)